MAHNLLKKKEELSKQVNMLLPPEWGRELDLVAEEDGLKPTVLGRSVLIKYLRERRASRLEQQSVIGS